MLTSDQIHKALTDILGFDAIDALILTADQLGSADLFARLDGQDGPMRVNVTSVINPAGDDHYTLSIGEAK